MWASSFWLSRLGRLASTRRSVIIVFLLVHVWQIVLNLWISPDGMGDVNVTYRDWMQSGFENGQWLGIDAPWVYPIVAIVPMVLAYLPGYALYSVSWLVLVTILDLIALLFVIRRGNYAAGIAWSIFLFAIGPIATGRIDAISVPLAVVGLVVLSRRPMLASVLLTLATWIKVWPGAVLAAIVIASRARVRVIVAAIATSAVICAIVALLGGAGQLVSFISQQGTRGLQIEAPISTPWLWAASWHVPDTAIYFDNQLLTQQVVGGGVDFASAAMNPLLAVSVIIALLLGVRAQRRGADLTHLLIVLSTALISSLIVFNKVGSPQYYVWFTAPLVFIVYSGYTNRYHLLLRGLILMAALTQLIYPYLYFLITPWLNPIGLTLLTVRNGLVIAILIGSIVELGRLGTRSGLYGIEQMPAASAKDAVV